MLQHITNTEIDKLKWDKAIDSSHSPYPYAYSWYLDIACPGWEALADENYNNIMPLPWRKKAGIKYLYQPFFTQQFGLFQRAFDENIIKEALAKVRAGFQYAELQMNYSNTIGISNFKYKRRVTHHIDLSSPYDSLKKNYNNNLKRNLQKAQEHSLSISAGNDATELIKIFKQTKGKQVSELRTNDYNVLSMLCKTAGEKKHGSIYTVTSNGQTDAANFILFNHRYIVNLFPASTEKGREHYAMPFLIDNIIHQNSSSNKIFDFEGSDIPSVARFYKSFGAVEIPYLKICINQLPWHIRLLKRIKNGL